MGILIGQYCSARVSIEFLCNMGMWAVECSHVLKHHIDTLPSIPSRLYTDVDDLPKVLYDHKDCRNTAPYGPSFSAATTVLSTESLLAITSGLPIQASQSPVPGLQPWQDA